MPVRKIPKNYRSVTGRFYSVKNNRLIAFESTLERDFFLSLEFDNNVEFYEEQPLVISTEVEGRVARYTPDCLAQHFDGSETLYEVKYVADLEKDAEELAPRFAMAERYVSERNMNFSVVTELDIRGTKLENQRFIYGYSSPPQDFDNLQHDVIGTLGKPLPLDSLLSMLSAERMRQAVYIPAIWHLVFTDVLTIDIEIPITPKTIIQVGHGANIV